MTKGPEQTRYEAAVDSAAPGDPRRAAGDWEAAAANLRFVAQALRSKTGTATTIAPHTGPKIGDAFERSAQGMEDKAVELDRGAKALRQAAQTLQTAKDDRAKLKPLDDPGTYTGPSQPKTPEEVKARSDYDTAAGTYEKNRRFNETLARGHNQGMDDQNQQSTAVMKSIHGEPDPVPQPTGPSGGGPGTVGGGGGSGGGSLSRASGGRATSTGGLQSEGGGGGGSGGSGGSGTTSTTPGSTGSPQGPSLGSESVPTPGTATAAPAAAGGLGSTAGGVAGAVGGGLLGGAGGVMGGARGGSVPASAGSSSARAIGSTSRAGAARTLGASGSTSRAATAGRGPATPGSASRAVTRAGAGGQAGGRGTSGQGKAGARRAGRAGAGGGRGGKKSDRDDAVTTDHLLDDQDWIDDEDAAPPVIG